MRAQMADGHENLRGRMDGYSMSCWRWDRVLGAVHRLVQRGTPFKLRSRCLTCASGTSLQKPAAKLGSELRSFVLMSIPVDVIHQ